MKKTLLLLALALCPASAFALKHADLKFPDGTVVDAEIADTPETYARGLMERTSLGKNKGMIFIFAEEDYRTFWMKNTWLDLDIIYLGADTRVVEVFRNVPKTPKNKPDAEPATVSAVAQYVIEVNAGFAKKHRLKAGDIIEINGSPDTKQKTKTKTAKKK